MATFRFRLDPVLVQRTRVVEREQGLVAIAQRAHDVARAEFRRLDAEFAEHSRILREEHSRLNTEELVLLYGHISYLDRAMDAAKRDLDLRRSELDAAMYSLHEAMKRRKVVETLKDHALGVFRLGEMRREQNELDDGNARRDERRTARNAEIGG
ncbi:MAG: flagellar FliJ family protein [Candidatus Eremiobacteraeota bacterium]|uniref:Flagellar FliJ protein n=1 Tax=mine drainage metagenome TaxID=410659 RepID=E6PHM9_9ZZZZ|nr:flagellar FliJ family protein [Candidatus Eremiobacteraeota bacterium]